jgi:hypothetical protein
MFKITKYKITIDARRNPTNILINRSTFTKASQIAHLGEALNLHHNTAKEIYEVNKRIHSNQYIARVET